VTEPQGEPQGGVDVEHKQGEHPAPAANLLHNSSCYPTAARIVCAAVCAAVCAEVGSLNQSPLSFVSLPFSVGGRYSLATCVQGPDFLRALNHQTLRTLLSWWCEGGAPRGPPVSLHELKSSFQPLSAAFGLGVCFLGICFAALQTFATHCNGTLLPLSSRGGEGGRWEQHWISTTGSVRLTGEDAHGRETQQSHSLRYSTS